MASGDVVNTAAACRAPPSQRRPGRRDDVPGDAPRDRVPRSARRRGEGQRRAGPGVARRPRTGAPRRRCRARVRARTCRPRAELRVIRDALEPHAARERPSSSRSSACRASARAASSTSSVRSCRRDPGAHHVASGPLPRIRRRSDAVGARRDRQGAGRHPSRTRRAEAAEKIGRAVDDVLADPADASWVRSKLLALVGLGGEASSATTAAARRSRRGDSSSRQWPSAAARARLRGPPLGRRGPARLHRRARRLGDRRAAARGRDGAAGAPRAPSRLGRRQAQRDDAGGRPALGRGHARLIAGSSTGPSSRGDPAGPARTGRRQPALRRAVLGAPRTGLDGRAPLPETLQGIIAARLDGLAQDEKGLLRDAAVIGKVFWVGALGRGRGRREAILHALERKGFIRRQRRVCGGRDGARVRPRARSRRRLRADRRADRAAKHRYVAEWIESLGRPDDHAEMLAHHWGSALELGRAARG